MLPVAYYYILWMYVSHKNYGILVTESILIISFNFFDWALLITSCH